MYAIIRAGGKQAKVREGDVIDVERIKEGTETVSFTPLLLVDEDGTVVSDPAALEKAAVTAEVVGEHRGEKIEVFKYKNKTGYRRSQGHRQTYTTIMVTTIAGPTSAKKASTKKASTKKAESTKADAADKKADAAETTPDTEATEEA
jgi:large subunit ribosomal protein L21